MAFRTDLIYEAKDRISPFVSHTPLVHLQNLDPIFGCHVYVKLENLQRQGAFKIRGAMNKLLSLSEAERAHGIVAASSGNHGRAVAYGAQLLDTSAVIIMPDTAPKVKMEAIQAMGAEILVCRSEERFKMAARVSRERGAVMVPPYNDELIMAGQGTIGLEIAMDLPQADLTVVPVSGGGLLAGVSAAIHKELPSCRVFGAEPAAVPRYSASLAAGRPITVQKEASLADALVSNRPGDLCFPVVKNYAEGVVPVEDRFLLRAWRTLLFEGKILAEPSAAIGLGAVLQGLIPVRPQMNVVFLISGGNVGLDQFHPLALDI